MNSNSNYNSTNGNTNGSVSSGTKAYYIAGHGFEGKGSFIVPEGCMIVVKQQHGELGYTNLDNPDNLELNLLKRLPLEVLQQPDLYTEEIIKSVGPVSIFKPGDRCPYFVYRLFACYEVRSICHTASGVIDLEKFQNSKDDKIVLKSKILSSDDILNERIKPFRHSIYPVYNQVNDLLFDDDKYPKFEETYNKLVFDVEFHVNNYTDKIKNKFKISQKKLCELHKGVYYNFVCRELSDDVRPNLIVHNLKLGKNVPVISSIIGLSQNKQTFFKRRLGESLKHRKPGVIKWYEKYGKPANTVFGGRRRSTKYQRTIKRSKNSLNSA